MQSKPHYLLLSLRGIEGKEEIIKRTADIKFKITKPSLKIRDWSLRNAWQWYIWQNTLLHQWFKQTCALRGYGLFDKLDLQLSSINECPGICNCRWDWSSTQGLVILFECQFTKKDQSNFAQNFVKCLSWLNKLWFVKKMTYS